MGFVSRELSPVTAFLRHFGLHRVQVLSIIVSILVLDQIRKDRKQTAQELKIDEVEKSRVWSLYQSAQEKRKQIIKIEDEIVVCDREIERLNEKIKVRLLAKNMYEGD